ncbi:response regulator transcription factor [Lactococcus termiticola]|nr:response regulator transcription factor [Lactococcus termiticola]
MKKQILIVEDELSISDYIAKELSFEDFDVLQAHDGLEAVSIFENEQKNLDIVLLDWMLPKLDGLEVLRRIKKINPLVPVIFVTARDYVGDAVAGLDAGADDYLTKPFEIEELLARLRLAFRKQTKPQTFKLGNLELDSLSHRVLLDGQDVSLTQREYSLLLYFFENQGKAVSRDDILDEVWGMSFAGRVNTVDTYVRYLRTKLGQELIETVRGMGYRLKEDEQ